jgi:hypothetical protein
MRARYPEKRKGATDLPLLRKTRDLLKSNYSLRKQDRIHVSDLLILNLTPLLSLEYPDSMGRRFCLDQPFGD